MFLNFFLILLSARKPEKLSYEPAAKQEAEFLGKSEMTFMFPMTAHFPLTCSLYHNRSDMNSTYQGVNLAVHVYLP